MLRRIEAAFNRVEKLSERLTSRLDEFEQQGIDTTKPRQLLIEAGEMITDGKNSLAKASEMIDSMLTSEDNLREIWQSVKTEIRKSVIAVKGAHQKVVEAIRITKGSLPDDQENENNQSN